MQIAVTYQKTKSIRSACSDAVGGSQFGTTATTVVDPPINKASSVSWTIAPLRIFRREPTVFRGRSARLCGRNRFGPPDV